MSAAGGVIDDARSLLAEPEVRLLPALPGPVDADGRKMRRPAE